MKSEHYFYNCSKEYVMSIEPKLFDEIQDVLSLLSKRDIQSEINQDLLWLLVSKGWAYDSAPSGLSELPPVDLSISNLNRELIKKNNKRQLCKTSSTVSADWHSDFAKIFDSRLVQIEAQFGKVESMFKDFCGFRIANFERRLALGIEIVMYEPNVYFSHRKSSVSGMAYYEIAKQTLPAIGLNCPIWLIGIKE